MEKIYALLSNQETACAETVLYASEYTATNRARVEAEIQRDPDAPVPGTWCDVSDNEALRNENMSPPEGVDEMEKIHFFNFDPRFCGSTQQARRVSLDPNEITCPDCMKQDTFELSEQGRAYLASLDAPR